MSINWLPAACTRLRIFISYSSEHRPLADEIAQTLKNEGHDVFFDKDSLPPGEEYNERIRSALRLADRCLFLIGRTSIEPGKYMLTEIEFAKAKWPVPSGRVLPVLIDPGLKPSELPVYLRSVNAITPKGSLAAEIAATVDRSRQISGTCRACLAVAIAAVLLSAAALAGVMLWRPAAPMADVVLLPIEKVHFRPGRGPPADLLAPGAPTDWIESQLTVTAMNVVYNRRDQGAVPASLRREELDLQIGSASYRYIWTYVVDIRREEGCAGDWLCTRIGWGDEPPRRTIEPAARDDVSGRIQSAARLARLHRPGPCTWRDNGDRR